MPTQNKSYLIAVLGGKGGVGKSVFSTNLALSFLLDTKRPVLLIDADPDTCGDDGMILGIKPQRSMADVTKFTGRVTQAMLKEFLSSHSSGLSMIPVAQKMADYNALSSPDIKRVMDAALSFFPFTVADCGSRLTPQTLAILEQATIILVLTNPEILVLKHTKRLIDELNGLMFPPEVVRIVINKYDPSNQITPQIVQSNLNVPILGAVQDDPDTSHNAITKGKPAILLAPKSLLSKNIYQIARVLQERGILDSLYGVNKTKKAEQQKDGAPAGSDFSSLETLSVKERRAGKVSEVTKLKRRIHKALIDNMDLKKMDLETKDDPNKLTILYEKTKRAVIGLLEKEDLSFLKSREDRALLIKAILDEALGLGPLEILLSEDTVSEIMVNGPDVIYMEKGGKVTLSPYTFSSSQQLMGVIERILAPIGRRIDEKSPYVDARLADGSRVHAIIPPLAIDGPTLTIRKFKKEKLGSDDLIRFGTVTKDMAEFFKAVIESRLNVIISGGTGSGKTTLLNILSSMIPEVERIITVEDSAELKLQQDHTVRLESRPPNIEGEGEVTIRDLVKCTLRMRPDRIIVGECRSGEALDMLQAMNTGHDGSLTTIHSNSPSDCIRRLETLVMMAGMELPAKAIREQIASAINIIIQQTRLSDGSRKVTYVTEVNGLRGEELLLNDIFLFKQSGVDSNGKVIGKFVATGYIPRFIETLEARGISIPKGLFSVG
jgi:septum site-determining protein MinD